MMKPAMPAFRPWSSACLPSEAETCERETSLSSSGRAPILRIFARSCADWIVKLPEIWAPFEPSMPSGFSRQLINGADTSSSSSAIAKCCEVSSGSWPNALSTPRSATRRVMAWNASRPWSVKLKLTIGWLPTVWSKLCSGLLMSVPERPGRSWTTHQRSGFGASGVRALLAQDEDAGGDLDDLGVRRAPSRSSASSACLARVERLTVGQRLAALLVEDVEARVGGGL